MSRDVIVGLICGLICGTMSLVCCFFIIQEQDNSVPIVIYKSSETTASDLVINKPVYKRIVPSKVVIPDHKVVIDQELVEFENKLRISNSWEKKAVLANEKAWKQDQKIAKNH